MYVKILNGHNCTYNYYNLKYTHHIVVLPRSTRTFFLNFLVTIEVVQFVSAFGVPPFIFKLKLKSMDREGSIAKKWGTTPDGQYELVSLTKDTMPDAIAVMRVAFFGEEAVSVACELPNNMEVIEELEDMLRHVANDGISLIAVEIATGQVVAVSFNRFEYSSSPDGDDYFVNLQKICRTLNAKCYLQFIIDIVKEFDVFKHYNAKALIEIMFLATLKEHRGHGIAKAMVQADMKLAKRIRDGEEVRTFVGLTKPVLPIPTVITVFCTSLITKKIAKNLAFTNLKFTDFNKWSFNGKTFAEIIGPERPGVSLECYCL